MSAQENNQNNQNNQKISDTAFTTPTLDKIMKDIETNTEKQIKEANTEPALEVLVNIMQKGADEFKEKTGRNMTYSEMRQMYG